MVLSVIVAAAEKYILERRGLVWRPELRNIRIPGKRTEEYCHRRACMEPPPLPICGCEETSVIERAGKRRKLRVISCYIFNLHLRVSASIKMSDRSYPVTGSQLSLDYAHETMPINICLVCFRAYTL